MRGVSYAKVEALAYKMEEANRNICLAISEEVSAEAAEAELKAYNWVCDLLGISDKVSDERNKQRAVIEKLAHTLSLIEQE